MNAVRFPHERPAIDLITARDGNTNLLCEEGHTVPPKLCTAMVFCPATEIMTCWDNDLLLDLGRPDDTWSNLYHLHILAVCCPSAPWAPAARGHVHCPGELFQAHHPLGQTLSLSPLTLPWCSSIPVPQAPSLPLCSPREISKPSHKWQYNSK